MVFLIGIFFLLCSCSKIIYLGEQGLGQLKILNRGIKNEVILKSVRYSPDVKDKIEKISTYKRYFYQKFQRPQEDIYNATVFLEGDAVTYLVTASPFYKITPHQECFWPMGCFPYLGFFSKKSAQEYAENLQKKGLVTSLRPVYAYSTLGFFSDNILSSFFYFDEVELAELVFHELFHTIFYITDEVDLNENLANFFAKKMVDDYYSNKFLDFSFEDKENSLNILNKEMVKHVKKINEIYKRFQPTTKENAEKILKSYLKKQLLPKIKTFCYENNILNENCFPLHRNWNNANLVAYMTYSSYSKQIEHLYQRHGGDLVVFFDYLTQEYEKYRNLSLEKTFTEYFLKKTSI